MSVQHLQPTLRRYYEERRGLVVHVYAED